MSLGRLNKELLSGIVLRGLLSKKGQQEIGDLVNGTDDCPIRAY